MPDETPKTGAQQRATQYDGYHTKEWGPKGHKHTVYQCDTCPYDSTDEAKVAVHVQSLGHAPR